MTHSHDSRRIALVVDDSPETLRLLTDALDAAGFTVMVALDGESALKIAGHITPDVVLLDAVMPGMSGFTACRRLKQEPPLAHVPVIFMTGLTETAHILEGLAAGGVDYVTKPIVIDEMLARIRVHSTNARLTASAQAALDTSGRTLLAVDISGDVLWLTPVARKRLGPTLVKGKARPSALPAGLARWLRDVAAISESERQRELVTPLPGDPSSTLTFVGRMGEDEYLLRLGSGQVEDAPARLRQSFDLTHREGEVLWWIAAGKSNRDIAAILSLSPRTVDKHLEQVYLKLRVENRTAAATLALRSLGQL
ncbi:response regulator transcription factor [Chelatococcus sp. YT9]|uniref:response regulator transcription factor n=1 Tax=Chelatococcus sp. YT9 TaxID=2835635 RepID=UPI001BCE1351|nr:response regulator transcription factor [Chelatococcus sp. YT9]MBS7701248.1 response regulator transcription factor [Chelatococcus sp. YT9]